MSPSLIRRTLGSLRIPPVVAALMAVTAVVSIVASVAARNGAPGLVSGGLLVTPAVWHGQIWRLATWVLYELDALSLLFACLTLYWFGGDLARAWGARRFLAVYLGLAVAAATVTCLVALIWPAVAQIPQVGSWPVQTGLIVAWGLLHPQRELRLYFVVRVTGRQLVWVTLAGTVLFSLFNGLARYVPHFAAQLLMMAWLGPARRGLARWRRARHAPARSWTFERWLERDRRR
jgi:membrane associated rhomboid family serine protease